MPQECREAHDFRPRVAQPPGARHSRSDVTLGGMPVPPKRRALELRDRRPGHETYTDAVLRTGQPTGPPSDALDTAAIVHLADHEQ